MFQSVLIPEENSPKDPPRRANCRLIIAFIAWDLRVHIYLYLPFFSYFQAKYMWKKPHSMCSEKLEYIRQNLNSFFHNVNKYVEKQVTKQIKIRQHKQTKFKIHVFPKLKSFLLVNNYRNTPYSKSYYWFKFNI